MMAIGVLNEPPKRTAFADVSNSFKANASRDDSAVSGKSIPSQDFVKVIAPQDKPASGAFLGPARRPLNAPAIKAPINAQTIAQPVHTIPTVPQVQQQQLQAAIKRTFSKRGTTIYKDTSDVEQQPQAPRQPAAPTAPVHQSLGPRHHKSQPQLKADQPNLRRTQSRYISVEAPETVITSDQIYQDAPEEQLPEDSKLIYAEFLKVITETESIPAHEVSKATEDAFDRLNHSLPAPPTVSEPEEYWEEEEEEIYDEQGYTTAHSYHSRGDNTTGGATTVLLPKITNKVKKELAEAKVLVESNRTLEEIDDELWDTSMVAEYGDEIFAYMRELEVSLNSSYCLASFPLCTRSYNRIVLLHCILSFALFIDLIASPAVAYATISVTS
jgi:G2/mitotic-specific cyclin 3/4